MLCRSARSHESFIGNDGHVRNLFTGLNLGDDVQNASSLQGVALHVAVDLAGQGAGQAFLGGVEGDDDDVAATP